MITTVFGLSMAQTNQVLDATCRAPSLLNSQPWAFRLASDRIELHIDPSRALPASDPDGREARLACGAALFNLRLALARQGVSTLVSVPSEQRGGPVAVVEQGGNFGFTPERSNLERAIMHRRTNRRPFFDAEVSTGHRQTLARAAEAEHATLEMILAQPDLEQLHRWALAAHRTQLADPAWTSEWAKWTGRVDSSDGVPASAAGPKPTLDDQWTLRDFGRPGRPDRVQGKDFEDKPLLAVLCSYSDSARAQLQAGQAMERVLLEATSLGLAASFLSQLIEVEPVRHQLRSLLGGQIYPQAVMRIGFGGPVPTTPRRPALDCLLAEPVPLS